MEWETSRKLEEQTAASKAMPSKAREDVAFDGLIYHLRIPMPAGYPELLPQ